MGEIINKKEYAQIINNHIYKNNYKKFIEKISEDPNFINGDFVPLTIEEKMKYNRMHSTIIKFGDSMEELLTVYIEKIFKDSGNYKKLNKKIKKAESMSGKSFSIDQLFILNDKIYLIEQKIGDGHDSTKKRGQFDNFETKYIEIQNKYADVEIIPIMWFMDDKVKKNENYYLERMEKMKSKYKRCNPKLCYGKELFDNRKGISDLPDEAWDEIMLNLKIWKTSYKSFDLDLDKSVSEHIDEIRSIKPEVFIRIFNNKEVVDDILPAIFPEGTALREYAKFLKTKYKNKDKYNNLLNEINKYVEKRRKKIGEAKNGI
mgnify:CR=1 FL=1